MVRCGRRLGRDGRGLIALARKYKASREATLRRYAEPNASAVAAVYFAGKLKPTRRATVGDVGRLNLFGLDPEAEARAASELRVSYAILSGAFSAAGSYLPRDKSVANSGPLYEATTTGRPADGECDPELGPASGRDPVHAVPLWTPDEHQGPSGERAVAAILRPLRVRSPTPKDKWKWSRPGLVG